MSVYSVVAPDSQILEGLNGVKKVVVVGCTGCANTSLASINNEPFSRIEVNAETGAKTLVPLPMAAEIERIRKMLEQHGFSAQTELVGGNNLCARAPETEAVEAEFVSRCAGVEAAVGVVCDAGLPALKEHFGEAVRVVPGMKVMGVQHRTILLDENKNVLFHDENRTKPFILRKS